MVTFCVTSQTLGHKIDVSRVWLQRDTFSGPRNQPIEMSNFLRRALDFRRSQDASFRDGLVRFHSSCKPFRFRHDSQHCKVVSVHGDSWLPCCRKKIARRSSIFHKFQLSHQKKLSAHGSISRAPPLGGGRPRPCQDCATLAAAPL